MPIGKRRMALSNSIKHTLLPLFVGRELAFDRACTHAYAKVLVLLQESIVHF